jgi:ribosomal protein S18 acetylase RimI-like enzyme
VLATYARGVRDGMPIADLLEPAGDATPGELLDACLRERAGWIVVAPPDLGRLLIGAGAKPRRHARTMTHDLRAVRPSTDPRVVAYAGGAEELDHAHRAAYRPDHPDYAQAMEPDSLGPLMRGEVIGPVLGASRIAVDDGLVVGAAVVCEPPGDPPDGGPWLAELFRHPGHPGLGRELLRATLTSAAEDGLPALGLAVTVGNPALGLYCDEGFRLVREDISVVVPA